MKCCDVSDQLIAVPNTTCGFTSASPVPELTVGAQGSTDDDPSTGLQRTEPVDQTLQLEVLCTRRVSVPAGDQLLHTRLLSMQSQDV